MAKKRTLVSLIVLASLLAVIVAGVLFGRSLLLRRIKGQVQATFRYERLRLTFLPPTLILEDVRTRTDPPSMAARRVAISIRLLALLSKQKPITVVIERPVIRIVQTGAQAKPLDLTSLPFVIERGWIRDGEISIRGPWGSLHGRGLNAFFAGNGQQFAVRAQAAQSVLSLASSNRQLAAAVRLSAEGKGNELRFRNLILEGPDLALKARGRFGPLSDPLFDLGISFGADTSLATDLLGIPFDLAGRTRGRGRLVRGPQGLSLDADIFNPELMMSGLAQGQVSGRVELRRNSGTVDLTLNRRPPDRGRVQIRFGPQGLVGTVDNVGLNPVMKAIALPWPVRSRAWGEFRFSNRVLEVDAELLDTGPSPADPDRFRFQGKAHIAWDESSQHVTISANRLWSSFAQLDVDGRLNIGRDLDISLDGEVSDVREARRFTEIILAQKFPLPDIGGRGSAAVRIFGRFQAPSVNAQYFLFPGRFDKLEAAFVEGSTDFTPEKITGLVRVDDPLMTGVVTFASRGQGVEVKVSAPRARLEKVLPEFSVPLPFSGEAAGEFSVTLAPDRTYVQGRFTSGETMLYGQAFRDVQGRLEILNGVLDFPEMKFTWHRGAVASRWQLDLPAGRYDLDVTGSGVDLASLQPDLRGLLSFTLKGSGLLGTDRAVGRLDVRDPAYNFMEAASLGGDVALSLAPDGLEARFEGSFAPGQNECSVGLTLPFTAGPFSLDIKGSFENLDLLLPWKGAKGRLNYLTEVSGNGPSPAVKGVLDVQASVLPIPQFPQALTEVSGLFFLENGRLSVRSLQATLGGGLVNGTGEVAFNGQGFRMDVGLEGKDLLLVPLERTRAVADGSLRLVKNSEGFVLDGDFRFKRVSWRREITERFVFSSTPFYQPPSGPGLFDDLTLNIRLRADDNAWVENGLGRIRGRFDLAVLGHVNSPILMGDIEALEGYVNFQDQRFNLLRGRLSFFNPAAVDPYIDVKAEALVKDYRVMFTLTGLLDHLKPEFSSSPPLPPEDILALLAMGEAFKRTYSAEASSRLSTTSLLTFQLAEEARKRTSGIFSIDRLSIDPFLLGSSTEMVPRLTLGKRISRNAYIQYSANLTTQREEIVRVEWDLGKSFSLVGLRDERGRFSLYVKTRKRF